MGEGIGKFPVLFDEWVPFFSGPSLGGNAVSISFSSLRDEKLFCLNCCAVLPGKIPVPA